MSDLRGDEIERVFREEYGRAVAVLIRAFGDIGMAEEAVQDAFIEAMQRWPSAGLLALYDQLMAIAPSPVTALNRAVAVAEVRGPHEALSLVDRLNLSDYYPFHAIRADLLRRLGRNVEAKRAYDAAIARSYNTAEKNFLKHRRQTVDDAQA
jgi:predicted RNA polymerase sigma factor